VWRSSTGMWYILSSLNGQVTWAQWGDKSLGDSPVPADYDGDGKTDFGVWRSSDGWWLILQSSNQQLKAAQWGQKSLLDTPVPGDYDGDGKADVAVWRKSDGFWYILRSATSQLQWANWGNPASDTPVPGDYDGDGKTDIAIWRDSDGTWYVLKSSDGLLKAAQWGDNSLGDRPVRMIPQATISGTLTLATTAPQSVLLGGVEVDVVLPAGVTVKANASNALTEITYLRSFSLKSAVYTPATASTPGKIRVVGLNLSGFAGGAFAQVTCYTEAGSVPDSSAFTPMNVLITTTGGGTASYDVTVTYQ